jgi:hypothetical protein
MENSKIKYDEISDTLTVVFESGKPSTGIELTDHILLRLDPQTGVAVSLSFFDYSVLSQTTELGLRSFPLTGLANLSKELQESTLGVLQKEPVCEFLQVSAYTPFLHQTLPIVLLQPVIEKITAAA